MSDERDDPPSREAMADEPDRIVPGNRRRAQRPRRGRRELFGKERKEIFLEVLATTCNVAAAAEAAGVAVNTVYAHRLKDAEFREKWWMALEQGAAKLVTLRLQREIERAEGRLQTLDVKLDGPPDERQIADLYKLIHLLREHSRGLGGEGKAGRPPATAGVDEMCKALAKRLKAFEARERGKDSPSHEATADGGPPSGEAGADQGPDK